jgi:large subunit ribosomal protein L29
MANKELKVDLRAKSIDELNVELEALLKSHFSLRMQVSMQQLSKTSELRKVRRDIARVRTILREKV